MKKIFVVMVCLTMSSAAYAQFGGFFDKVKENLPGGPNSSVSSEQLVKKYTVSAGHTLNAHARLLSAFGLKEMSETIDAKARHLTEGTLSGKEIEETEKVITESTKALQEKFADEKTVLDEEGRKEYNEGRVNLAQASLAYTDTALDAKNYKPGIRSINTTGRLAINIGKKLPGDIKNLKTVIGMVKEYSKANNIEDDDELDDATSKLPF